MSRLLGLFLVIHGGIHIGYICGPAWPFAAGEPWLVTQLGAAPDTVRAVGIALALVAFVGFLLAAIPATGLATALWPVLVPVAAVTSAILLVLFVTPWTLPGLAIDVVLLFATFARGWRPTPFSGRRGRTAPAGRVAA
jgi:hypothetical protein